ncbi:hypothetical protein [Halomarina ordinaria]|uniref:DUF4157 domain-containing protein n=1 Tax=Halomarina ordinaria TaxID=3033939 RepID=A0ABD5UC56_9EURY|nr:hypothetical protein [Halomarina sp. PSRA2]
MQTMHVGHYLQQTVADEAERNALEASSDNSNERSLPARASTNRVR